MQKLVLLALAGGFGSLSRYGLSGLVQRFTGPSFPYGTFAVNALGCLLFGLVWGVFDRSLDLSPTTRVVVLTGFMGAFTTFSTFAFESTALLEQGQWFAAAANILGQNALGIVCVFAGLAVARSF